MSRKYKAASSNKASKAHRASRKKQINNQSKYEMK